MRHERHVLRSSFGLTRERFVKMSITRVNAAQRDPRRAVGRVTPCTNSDRWRPEGRHVVTRPIAVEELIAAAAAGLPSARVRIHVPPGLPLVRTDPALLERVLINLVANADRHSPASVPILID